MAYNNKLTAAFVRTVEHSGRTRGDERHADGNGLMLNVKGTGGKSWVQRIVVNGTRRTFGLGKYPLVSLAEAREKAFENAKCARSGGDPLAERRRADTPNFRAAAEAAIQLRLPSWKPGSTSENDWRSSLGNYAFPLIGDTPVGDITTSDVRRVIEPIWNSKRVTASRLLKRIELVLAWSKTNGYRADNPAVDVDEGLPQGRVKKERHAALPYAEVAAAIRAVQGTGAMPATKLAFEWLAITASRTMEALKARWDEIDGDTWAIPDERMKAGKAHRVPLPPRCLAILEEAKPLRVGDLIFPSRNGEAMSNNTIRPLVKRQGFDMTVHGLRSSFRDWAAECTDTPHAVMEAALAHSVRNQAEAAYARSDLFDRRRVLMEQWADYLAK